MSKMLRQEKRQWSQFLDFFGVAWGENILLSSMAMQSQLSRRVLQSEAPAAVGAGAVRADRVRDEYSVSTSASMAICFCWLQCRRSARNRGVALGLLRGWLSKCMSAIEWAQLDLRAIAEEHSDACAEDAEGGSCCAHVRGFWNSLDERDIVDSAHLLCDRALRLLPFVAKCIVARAILSQLIRALADLVDGRVVVVGNANITSWSDTGPAMKKAPSRRG